MKQLSHTFMQRAAALTVVLLLSSTAALAQSQAACRFTFLPIKVKIPTFGTVTWSPRGINDWGTIVGSVSTPTGVGIIRWVGGGVTAVSKTNLVARNNEGISIGYREVWVGNGTQAQPIVLNRDLTITDIRLKGLTAQEQLDEEVNGINKWGTIVGTYFPNFPYHQAGFKRWRHGGFITLDFPGSFMTTPLSINDNGVVVGYYVPANGRTDGFIYNKGEWATLDLPNISQTALVGVTNAGLIIGNGYKLSGGTRPFLYENGTFKMISVPNAIPGTTKLMSISPKRGLILGIAGFSPSRKVFVATCQ